MSTILAICLAAAAALTAAIVSHPDQPAAAASIVTVTAADTADRAQHAQAPSRDLTRVPPPKPLPTPTPPAPTPTPAPARAAAPAPAAPTTGNRALGHQMMLAAGWPEDQWPCLDALWTRESGWTTTAANPSGAYGIPQALPGSKMATAGADWATNPATQIRWGLGYIRARYGTPCGAWNASETQGWY
jgi:hypothetical protein